MEEQVPWQLLHGVQARREEAAQPEVGSAGVGGGGPGAPSVSHLLAVAQMGLCCREWPAVTPRLTFLGQRRGAGPWPRQQRMRLVSGTPGAAPAQAWGRRRARPLLAALP